MNGPPSIKEVCDALVCFEKDYDLLDFEVNGVKVWQYGRMAAYYKVARALGTIDAPHPGTKNNLKTKLRKKFSLLRSVLFHNPFIRTPKADILIVDHPRSVRSEGKWIDIYTEPLLDALAQMGQTYHVLEPAQNGQHLRSASARRQHLDVFTFIYKIKRLLKVVPLSDGEKEQIEAIEAALAARLGVSIPLKTEFARNATRFRLYASLYKRLLQTMKVQSVYLVVSYSHNGDLISAAKELGIPVTELQHGVFSPYHLGYSFPGRKESVECFPDRLLTWGSFWRTMAPMPIREDKIEVFGFPYFYSMRSKHEPFLRKSRTIVVLSQGAISTMLAEQMTRVAEDLADYTIYYKLHPSEYGRWRENQCLVALAEQDHIEIVDRHYDLYQLFSTCEYQFGVFSTALFEGLGMGCKTLLFDLPGREYMNPLIDRKMSVLHEEGASIQQSLKTLDRLPPFDAAEELFGPPPAQQKERVRDLLAFQ